MPEHPDTSLIEALKRPGLLGVGDVPVEVLETHISWVLLAGDYAFKFKKPLDLGFLDFSTLEKRRQACEDELRLNRRLAPDLYLDVVAVAGTPRSPVVGGKGGVLEYAVKMRRFAQERLLSEMLHRGEIGPHLVDAIADEVARFHQTIPAAASDSPWGTPEAVWHPVAENFRHIASTPLQPHHEAELAELQTWSRQEFDARRQRITERRSHGFIRECHGDMHLGNMVALDGRVVIFDCLEFNAALRWIDTASEVAFLVMDLADRGAPQSAARALDRYLGITGDYDALGILRFYLVYRAMVRTKVNAIRCQQEQEQGESFEAALADAAGYLRLAHRYTIPTSPFIAITCGLSGSGKTTATQSLLERSGAIRLRSDVERKRLAGLAATERTHSALGAGVYSSSATATTYTHLLDLCQRVVTDGWPVIVDATFLLHDQRQPFLELAAEQGVPFVVLEFQAAPQTLEERIQNRMRERSDASEATVEVLHRQLESQEPLTAAERRYAVTLNTEESDQTAEWEERVLERCRSKHGNERIDHD